MTYSSGEILFNKYRIEEFLGQGVFSEAYRVTELSHQVTRALKVLRPDAVLPSGTGIDDFQTHFEFEAKLIRELNAVRSHPNLIEVIEVQREGNLLTLEREYASGSNLADLIQQIHAKNRLIPLVEGIQKVLDVAEGLSILHAREVVHRNLKPTNILFDSFGLAKISDLYQSQISSKGELGLPTYPLIPVPGPSDYASPELGHTHHKLTPSSDVYSLGLLLFETLSGYPYHNFKSNTRLVTIRPDTPQWLDELLAQMLSHEPEKRPWDAAVVAALLRADLDRLISARKTAIVDDVEYTPQDVARKASGLMVNPPQPSQADAGLSTPFYIPRSPAKGPQIPVWKQLLNLLAMMIRQPAFIALTLVIAVLMCWVLYEIMIR